MRYENLPEIKKAKELCDSYGVSDSSPKIDLDKVLLDNKITLKESSLPSEVSGALDMRGTNRTILVNAAHSAVRKRFTIAHELGHFFMKTSLNSVHMSAATFFRNALSAKGTDSAEKQANRFAAELLMPSAILRKKLLNAGNLLENDDGTKLKEIADEFGVSVSALTIKIGGLLKTL